jgi:hypothetical protein
MLASGVRKVREILASEYFLENRDGTHASTTTQRSYRNTRTTPRKVDYPLHDGYHTRRNRDARRADADARTQLNAEGSRKEGIGIARDADTGEKAEEDRAYVFTKKEDC